MIKVNGTREPLEFKSHQWFGASVKTHKGKVVVSGHDVSQLISEMLICHYHTSLKKLNTKFAPLLFKTSSCHLGQYFFNNIICRVGMCSSLPLADGEDEWGEGPCGDLLCGCPEFQRLRRVLTLQDQ